MLKVPPKTIHVDELSEMNIKNYLYSVWKTLEKHPNSVSGNINGIDIVMFNE